MGKVIDLEEAKAERMEQAAGRLLAAQACIEGDRVVLSLPPGVQALSMHPSSAEALARALLTLAAGARRHDPG